MMIISIIFFRFEMKKSIDCVSRILFRIGFKENYFVLQASFV
jgi:hypothetical protein